MSIPPDEISKLKQEIANIEKNMQRASPETQQYMEKTMTEMKAVFEGLNMPITDEQNTTTGLDRIKCHACDELDGHMSDLTYNGGEGCAYCPVGHFMNMTTVKQSDTPDDRTTRLEACTLCTKGKYIPPDYVAATQCLPCPTCPD